MSVLAQRLHIYNVITFASKNQQPGQFWELWFPSVFFIRFEVRLALASPTNWNASVETTPSHDPAFLLIVLL